MATGPENERANTRSPRAGVAAPGLPPRLPPPGPDAHAGDLGRRMARAGRQGKEEAERSSAPRGDSGGASPRRRAAADDRGVASPVSMKPTTRNDGVPGVDASEVGVEPPPMIFLWKRNARSDSGLGFLAKNRDLMSTHSKLPLPDHPHHHRDVVLLAPHRIGRRHRLPQLAGHKRAKAGSGRRLHTAQHHARRRCIRSIR